MCFHWSWSHLVVSYGSLIVKLATQSRLCHHVQTDRALINSEKPEESRVCSGHTTDRRARLSGFHQDRRTWMHLIWYHMGIAKWDQMFWLELRDYQITWVQISDTHSLPVSLTDPDKIEMRLVRGSMRQGTDTCARLDCMYAHPFLAEIIHKKSLN